ncbi:MAG: AmmeMemoRadiSam system protein B [Isosphaeraceae bacterium]|nr:AmmeMemoRadiSam system protein B [Isosphaeraceae bacterium]
MATLEQPLLRRTLSGREVTHQGESYIRFHDEAGTFDEPVLVPTAWYQLLLRAFDGSATLQDHQARVLTETGTFVPLERLGSIVADLDRALLLEGPTLERYLEEYRSSRLRPAHLAGRSYAGTAKALRAQIGAIFGDPDPLDAAASPGESVEDSASPSLRGIVSPHIDFQRGGHVYGHAYRELIERSDAEIFVIIGVAHKLCRRRFALTYKDFETPLGLAKTDRGFVDRMVEVAGDDFFDDEIAHRAEHSIEFQVVMLQFLLGDRRPFSIVPILVGSFHDLMPSGQDPKSDPQVARMIEALRAAENDCGSRVCYIGGIDLCHVGPEFGDADPVHDSLLTELRDFDARMLEHAGRGDAPSWFREAAAIGNRYRVCGLAAGYTLLEAMGPTRGRLLRYDQSVDPARRCCVTVAGVAHYLRDPVESAHEARPR